MPAPALHRWLLLALLLPACTVISRPLPHGQEPLGGIWYFKAGDDPAWASAGLDETDVDGGWRVVDVPGGLREYASRDDTGGWLRVRFIAPPALLAAEPVLVLGRADSTIDAHLNGVCLGGVPKDAGESVIRAFNVPRGVLRESNILAVRVTDWGKPGGIVGGPVALMTEAEWDAVVRQPGDGASLHAFEGAYARAAYDPDRHRLVSFGTRDKTVLDDAHFVLRTKVREYDLSRIPEAEVETLPDGRGVRTQHVLAGEGIRFEARYVLPAAVEWPALVVVGEAKAEDGRAVDVDLVYHPAAPGVIGTGALRTTPDGRFTWGRFFVYAPKGDLEILPDSVRKYYRPDGAFEVMALAVQDAENQVADKRRYVLDYLKKMRGFVDDVQIVDWTVEVMRGKVTLDITDAPLDVIYTLLLHGQNFMVLTDESAAPIRMQASLKKTDATISECLTDIFKPNGWYLHGGCGLFEIIVTDAEKAKRGWESNRIAKAQRQSIFDRRLNVPSGSMKQTVEKLRSEYSLSICVDPDIHAAGLNVEASASGEPFSQYMDRVLPPIRAKWAYCEGTVYIYMPAAK